MVVDVKDAAAVVGRERVKRVLQRRRMQRMRLKLRLVVQVLPMLVR